MPGKLHQGTLELFRDDPWLAFDLLGIERPVSGTPIDRRGEVEHVDPEEPEKVGMGFPDLVLVHRDEAKPKRGIVITVEAQGEYDAEKRWRIPYYHALLAEEYRLPTYVVVVSYHAQMSASLRKWAKGVPPRVDVMLLDAETVPRITDLEQARSRPTAAVLSATVHGCRGDIEVARVAIQACAGLPERKYRSYIQTIMAAVPKSQRPALEAEVSVQQVTRIWEIERRSGSFQNGREEGQALGRQRTLIEMIEALLEVRKIALMPADVERIRAQRELPTLERWARRAREVDSVAELFADG